MVLLKPAVHSVKVVKGDAAGGKRLPLWAEDPLRVLHRMDPRARHAEPRELCAQLQTPLKRIP